MPKLRPPILLLLLAFIASAPFPACSSNSDALPAARMDIKGHMFNLEIASTKLQRDKGLMSRDSMEEDHGMIFLFAKPGIYSFWMHNTRIPLDIIWLSALGDVVHIETMPPYDEQGRENEDPALYVIELNAGKARELALHKGDRLIIPASVLKIKPAESDE